MADIEELLTHLADILDPDDFRKNLNLKMAVLPLSARETGKQSCCSSSHCCWTLPGSLTEEDVDLIAKHLSISREELYKKYLTVTYNYEDFRLLPVRKNMEAGGYTSMAANRVISPCVFLDEIDGNKCNIHDVKPKECRDYKCWERDDDAMPNVSLPFLMKLGWSGEVTADDKDYIAETNGSKE